MSEVTLPYLPPFVVTVRRSSTGERLIEAVVIGVGETAYLYDEDVNGVMLKVAKLIQERKL